LADATDNAHITTRIATFVDRLRRAVDESPDAPLISPGDGFLVACSGGVDSSALLCGLQALSLDPRRLWRPVVAHVHHGLRGAAADEDAAWVEALADQLDLPCHVVHVDTPRFAAASGRSPEDAARVLRYRALEQLARRHGCAAIAVAHHRDDQAETLLLRILRGTGIDGLAGIPLRRPVSRSADAPQIVRPLLGFRRADLRLYLDDLGVEARQDHTNLDPSAAERNHVRLALLPGLRELLPGIDERLVRIAHIARSARERIAEAADAALGALAKPAPALPARMPLARLRGAAEWLRPYVVREFVRRSTGMELLRPHAEAVLHLATRAAGGGEVHLPRGLRARREHGALVLEKRPDEEAPPPPVLLRVPGTTDAAGHGVRVACAHTGSFPKPKVRKLLPHVAWLDADAIGHARLRLRTPLSGDRMRPVGLGGSKKLQDIFTDAKVPRPDRERALVLEVGDHIAWVVGLRIDERFAATGASRSIIRVGVSGRR
jgi:tRNA(Ile)-lysidine synthase